MSCNQNCRQGRDCDCSPSVGGIRLLLVALVLFWVGVGAWLLRSCS